MLARLTTVVLLALLLIFQYRTDRPAQSCGFKRNCAIAWRWCKRQCREGANLRPVASGGGRFARAILETVESPL